MNNYKCAHCGCPINKGEFDTFGVCDDCWDKNHLKQTETKESPVLKRGDAGYKYFTCPTCDGSGAISEEKHRELNESIKK